jgi:hypothetical protein
MGERRKSFLVIYSFLADLSGAGFPSDLLSAVLFSAVLLSVVLLSAVFV